MMKKDIAFLVPFLGFAFTGDANAEATVKLTGYSASCRYDSLGDGNKSPSGLKPRSHTLDGSNPLVLVAVPQHGGSSYFYGCYLKFDFSQSRVPQSIRDLFAVKQFYAGDHYGRKSNFQYKMDISLECKRTVNNFTWKGVKVSATSCPGRISHRERSVPHRRRNDDQRVSSFSDNSAVD